MRDGRQSSTAATAPPPAAFFSADVIRPAGRAVYRCSQEEIDVLAALSVDRTPTTRPAGADADHRDLMARVAEWRDKEAFRSLFLHFGPRIKAMMTRSGADAGLAEDLVQDVMLTVWRKVRQYSPERGSVAAWIFTIARNTRIDRLRSGSSRPHEDVDDMEIVSAEPTGEDVAISRERDGKVRDALSGLPEDQRRIVELAFVEDMSQSAIAERLDLPLGTVKSRMRLAYGKLKVTLEDLQ